LQICKVHLITIIQLFQILPFEDKNLLKRHIITLKLTPNTTEQLVMLDELDNSDDENAPVLQDYPLDYET